MTSRSELRVEGKAIESSNKIAIDLPFRLATWIVRTMIRAEKLKNPNTEIDKCRVDAVGLSGGKNRVKPNWTVPQCTAPEEINPTEE